MAKNLLRIILFLQGLYFIITALWAIFDLESFSEITGHFGEAYEMHSISALAIVLGFAFIFGAKRDLYLVPASYLLLATNLAVIIPGIFYFEEIKNSLFLLDLIEESVVFLVAGLLLISYLRNVKR